MKTSIKNSVRRTILICGLIFLSSLLSTMNVTAQDAPAPQWVWQNIAGQLKQISVSAGGRVWGVNANDDIFTREGLNGGWQQISGKLKYVSVADSGRVWGVNSAGQIYTRDGVDGDWVGISGSLKQISVNKNGQVWGVNNDDNIYTREGVDGSWKQIDGKLKHVSVSNDGAVWGVNAADEIFTRNGVNGNWRLISGKLKQISVADSGQIWGVNANDEIFVRENDKWKLIPGQLKHVSVSSDGRVWGVNAGDAIFTREGITKTNEPEEKNTEPPVSGGQKTTDELNDPDIIPGEYIVVFKDDAFNASGLSMSSVSVGKGLTIEKASQALVNKAQGKLRHQYKSVLKGFSAKLSDEEVKKMKALPEVDHVSPVRKVYLHTIQTNPQNWGLDRIDQSNLPLNQQYEYNLTGNGVHVYIVDTGILGTHNDFTGRLGNGFDGISDGLGTGDCIGHGTHVAGIAGGNTFGVAKGVTLHPVRVFGCNDTTQNNIIINGLDWIKDHHQKPAVVNMSLGPDGHSKDIDTIKAVNNLIKEGIIVVKSAGNHDDDACLYDNVPEAITVGATMDNDRRPDVIDWGFLANGNPQGSNFGSCVDIFAPGDNITSAGIRNDTDTLTIGGTSQATPHVVGIAALIMEVNPNASQQTVADIIINNGTNGVLSNIGNGSPNLLAYSHLIKTYEYCLKGPGGYYVSSEGDMKSVNANRNECGAWEKHTIVDLNGGNLNSGEEVAIMSSHRRYWSAQRFGSLEANRTTRESWETFIIEKDGGGAIGNNDNVGFRSAHGKWIQAADGGGKEVNAKGDNRQGWETFTLFDPDKAPAKPSPKEYTFCLKAANSQYVSSENDLIHVNANRNWCQGWEAHTLIDFNGGDLNSGDEIAIRSSHGRYWSAQSDGRLEANRTERQSWETFKIYKDGSGSIGNNDNIGFLSFHNKWVVAEGGGGQEVKANRDQRQGWETFTLLDPRNAPTLPTQHTFCLKALNGQYVSSEGDLLHINANRDWCQSWEQHTLFDLNAGDLYSGDEVALKSVHSRYWSAQSDGRLEANRTELLGWEKFKIYKADGSSGKIGSGTPIGIQSAHSKWLVAEGGGGKEVNINRDVRSGWETFTFLSPQDAKPVVREYTFCLKAASRHYVSSEGDLYSVNANRDKCQGWEWHTIIDFNGAPLYSGDEVAIRSFHNRYWSAQSDGRLEANRTERSGWETFIIEKDGGGAIGNNDNVGFRSAHGKWIQAADGGGKEVNAKGGGRLGWETFTLFDTDKAPVREGSREQTICLTALNGQYVSSENDLIHVNANRNWCQGWEAHTLIDFNGGDLNSGDEIAIRSSHGRYWSAQSDGRLEANRTERSGWETFRVFKADYSNGKINSGTHIGIQSIHGKWLVAEGGGGKEVNINRTVRSGWETFGISFH